MDARVKPPGMTIGSHIKCRGGRRRLRLAALDAVEREVAEPGQAVLVRIGLPHRPMQLLCVLSRKVA